MRNARRMLGAVVLGATFAVTTAGASMLNAPHNEENNLTCKSCHEYPFDAWPGYVPDPNNPDDTVKNFICLRCHDGANPNPAYPNAPAKKLHSSQSLQGRIADWTTACVDCHDPHFQGQLDHYQTDPSQVYLVTGTYDAVSIDTASTPPTSTISYTLTGSSGTWGTDVAAWTAKTGVAGRGLILVADTDDPRETFEVVGATATTITVSGDLSQVAQGTNFGLIYGQLVRARVQLPASRGGGLAAVKFLDPNGGFTSTTTPDGICQVCHSVTNNWRYDGTVSVNSSDHHTGERCTTCHKAAEGFKASVPQHEAAGYVTRTALCLNCHQALTDPALDEVRTAIHSNDCAKCHTNPPALADPAQRQFVTQIARGECVTCHGNYFQGHTHHTLPSQNLLDSPECVTCHAANDPLAVHNNNCWNCHDPATGARIAGANGWGDATVNNGTGGACVDCHAAYFDGHTYGDNHLQVALRGTDLSNNTPCNNCHQVDADTSGTSLDSWTDIRTLHDVATNGAGPCATCHQSTRLTNDPNNPGETVADVIAQGQSGAQIGCLDCHASKTAAHADHVAMGTITGYASCNTCHDPSGVGTSSFYTDTLHPGCTTCHTDPASGDYTLKAGSAAEGHGRNDAGFGNPNTCATCHSGIAADWYNHDVDHQAKGFISLSGDCASCHGVTLSYPAFTDAGDNKKHDACSVCHNSDGSLVNPAAAGGAECVTCHGAYFDQHTNIDHTYRVALATACSYCHSNTAGTATGVPTDAADNTVHDACLACHAADGSLIGSAAGHSGATVGNPNDCATCHGDFGVNVHTAVDHSTKASLSTDCSGCHTNTAGNGGGMPTDPADNMVHDSCGACHGTTGALVGSAAGHSDPSSCNDCHGDFATKHASMDHSGAVGLSAECATCHDGTQGTATGMVVDPADAQKHDDCAQCHGATGALVGSAAGNTAPNVCVDCHGQYFPSHSHSHDVAMRGTDLSGGSSCNTCHGVGGTYNPTKFVNTWSDGANGILELHLADCATCHGSTRDNTTNPGTVDPTYGSVANVIATGTTVGCLNCHYDRSAGHGGHQPGATMVRMADACASCHDNDAANPADVIADIHNNTCTNCHDPGPPSLKATTAAGHAIPDPSTPPTNNGGGTCEDCHGTAYGHTVSNPTHPVEFGDGSLPGVDPATCSGCHSGTGVNADLLAIHMTDAKAGGRTWACEICHNNPEFNTLISNAINNVAPYDTRNVYCTDCHEYNDGVNPTLTPYAHVFPHGMIDHEGSGKVARNDLCVSCHDPNHTLDVMADIHGDGANPTCGKCHASAQGGGPLIPVLENDAQAVNGGTCDECHNTGIVMPNLGAFHGVTPADVAGRHDKFGGSTGATLNDYAACTDCHAAANAQQRLALHPGCATCHGSTKADVIATINSGKSSGGNTLIHCEDCHNNTANGVMSDMATHHATPHAQAGDCTWCHADPRPAWESSFGLNGPNPLPERLACQECHVQGGLNQNGSGLTVNKLAYQWSNGNPNSGYLQGVQTVGAIHTITSTSGQPIEVQNFGACLGCHNDVSTTAPDVNVYHARPVATNMHLSGQDTADKSNGSDATWSHTQYAQLHTLTWMNTFKRFGDGVWPANSGGIADLKTAYGKRYDQGSKPGKNWKNNFHKPGAPSGSYNQTVTIPCNSNVNDWEGQCNQVGPANSVAVPYFSSLNVGPVNDADLVSIASATWNGTGASELHVIAYNAMGSGTQLKVSYGGQVNNANMTWDNTIQAWTYTSGAVSWSAGSTVTVTSTAAGGGSATHTVIDGTVTGSGSGGGGGGDPAATHANYNAVPNSTLNDGTPCANCHTNGNLADYHYTKAKSCTWCHGSPVSGVDPYSLNLATVVCTDCHTIDTAVHPQDVMPDHTAFLVTTDTQCVSCHTGDVVNTVHQQTCSNCHDTSFGLKAGANGWGDATNHTLGGTSSCSVCHPNRAANFQNHVSPSHANVTGTASCQTCHTGAIPTVVHAACTSCHTNTTTDGSLRAGTVGDATGHVLGQPSACADCHTSHAADFFTGHTGPVDHVAKGHVTAATGATVTTNCAGCHNPADTINDPVAHNGQCNDCHDATTGVLHVGQSVPPFGDATQGPGDCNTCHGSYGYFEAHSHKNNHVVAFDPATDLGQSTAQPCSDCHNDNGGNLATFTDILVEHDLDGTKDGVGACVTCHDATRDVNPVTPSGTTVQDVIAAGANPTNCLDCHADKDHADHGGHAEGDGTFSWVTLCQSCHGIGGNSLAAPQGEIIGGVHANNCGFCHQGGVGGATLIGSAANATWGAKPHQCTECHTTYFDGHSHVHDVAYNSSLDLAQAAPGTGCANCHDDAGASLGNWNAILTEHLSSCATCHQYTDDGNATPPQTTVENTIYSGTGVHCLTCHTPKASPATHGGHPTDFGKSAVCTTCHTGANVVADIHNNNCANCHNGTPGRNSEKVGDRGLGDATLANGTAAANNWANVNCLTCHGTGYMTTVTTEGSGGMGGVTTYGGKHHLNVHAQGGDCDFCHDDPRRGPATDWESTFGVSGPGSLPKQLACIECHVQGGYNNQATGLQVNELAYQWSNGNPNSGYLTGVQTVKTIHNITSTSGQPIQVYNYGICLGCHNDAQKGRPVNVYHARPVATNMHLSGQDTADKSNGSDANWNHTQYAQLHTLSWPNTFKRFGDGVWDASSGGIADLKTAYGKRYDQGSKPGKNWQNNFHKPGAPSAPYNQTVTIPCNANTNDWEGQCNQVGPANSVAVPYFSDIPAPGPFGATAVDDSFTVAPDSSNNSLAVMANDSGSGISLQSVGAASHGTTAKSGNNVLYTPNPGYTGTDSFTYTIVDSSSQTSTATVTVNVNNAQPFTPISEGFESYNDGTSGPWGNPAWTPGDTGDGSMAQYWWADSNGTPSSSTGPSSAASGSKYVYLETSSNQASDNNRDYYIETPVVDGSTYAITLSFAWNMNVDNNNDAQLWVEAWNGSSWATVTTVNTGNNGDVWTTANIDLSAFTNSDLKARILYRRGSGTSYRNDIALDDLLLDGTVR